MAKPIVHGASYSTYVRSVLMALEEKGQPYEHRSVDFTIGEAATPHYRKLQPFGKIPAFEHGDFALHETVAINQYVDEVFPGPKLMPDTAAARARARQIMSVIDGHAYPSLISAIAVQRMFLPEGTGPDATVIAKARPHAIAALAALENLAGGDNFLVGNAITLADIHLAPVLAYFSQTPEWTEMSAATPKLTAWWSAMSKRPSFTKVAV